MHHVRYKSKNNEKENMKEEKIPCRIIRYREFPDLLFGTLREDGPVYFDATRFIQAKGDARRHNVRDSVSLSITGQRRWQTPTE